MLDVAGLIVDAVFLTIPASVWTYLERHRNPRTSNGKYRPLQRYHQDFIRKHVLCKICRQYWRQRPSPAMQANRFPGQPYSAYLPMDLVEQLVQCLLNEFRYRKGSFIHPFPRFETPETDYYTWELEAIGRVQEQLLVEATALLFW
jgi:hypothetical protein